MNTIFMNSENSKTYDTYRLVHNLTDKIYFKKMKNMLHYQALVSIIHEKYKKVIQKQ